ILMSVRENAPYADRIEDNGKTLIYEGHDIPNKQNGPDPKSADQQPRNPSGTLTQNGLFFKAAQSYKNGSSPEIVKVYEKIRSGIWTLNGFFQLVDGWIDNHDGRNVFKFRLESIENFRPETEKSSVEMEHPRLIPSAVKIEVWRRDKGRCVKCGSQDNLHFDHIIPYSKGGSSLVAENIQLLCARHNLKKRDNIQ
ncbi:MAG: HNH endonuclease, partial [Candidatus Promineifilaceae bacterium]